MIISGCQVNYHKVELISVTQGISVFMGCVSYFLAYFSDIPCHCFFVVFTFFSGEGSVVCSVTLLLLLLIFTEELIERITDSI
jgi:hypothetical protein